MIRCLPHLLTGAVLALLVGLVAGSAGAFFLWALDEAIQLHHRFPGLLWALPVVGALVAWVYHFYGKDAGRGTHLLIDEIHQPGGGVPARMAPLVLLGTLLTHVCGGSAGREGTAVQMGGSLAALLARWLKPGDENQRLMLMCGIAAGFGAVFGTPLAGAVFAMEVLVMGRMQLKGFVPVMLAAFTGHLACMTWGAHHTVYHLDVPLVREVGCQPLALLFVKTAFAGALFGLAACLFCALTHGLQKGLTRLGLHAVMKPVIGGCLVIALTYVLGTRDYLGLGVEAAREGGVSIVSSFEPGGATPWSWLWKTLFTVATVGSGFKGGEVTPLFFIGSTLGNALGVLMQEPVALFAAFGFVAVFAGAAKTPLACTVLGMELFGAANGPGFAVVCFMACLTSGRTGIYVTQKGPMPGGSKTD